MIILISFLCIQYFLKGKWLVLLYSIFIQSRSIDLFLSLRTLLQMNINILTFS